MTRYATTVTIAIYTAARPTPSDHDRVRAWVDSAHVEILDLDLDEGVTAVHFNEPETAEVPDPEPPTLNKVGQRGRVVEYDGNHYLILGLSATEPVWTVVRPNPERSYGQSDWETDRIDGSATVELVESWEHVAWVEDAADYFCVEATR